VKIIRLYGQKFDHFVQKYEFIDLEHFIL